MWLRASALLGDRAPHPFVHGETKALVEVALGAAQLDVLDDLGLRRQVRARPRPWSGAAGTVATRRARKAARAASPCFSIGVRKALRNCRAVAEQPRHQEIEQRPQLAQVVLQRRAGQAQALAGAQLGGRSRVDPGARVLDRLGFVEDHQVKLLGEQAPPGRGGAADRWSGPDREPRSRRSAACDRCHAASARAARGRNARPRAANWPSGWSAPRRGPADPAGRSSSRP